MRLTSFTDYGLRALMRLASEPERGFSTAELADEFRISRNPRAGPIYERGYLDMVVPYDLAEDVADGVYYAGMASASQYPERSLNGGIVAGYECADRLLEE